MFRRAIFLSLIALFVLVIVWTLVRPYQGKKPPPQQGEIVKQSKPTPTRVLRPADLQVTLSEIELIGRDSSSKHKDTRAKHRLTIQNNGSVAYRNIMLEFAYQDRKGKTTKTNTCLLEETVGAGHTVSIPEFVADSVPAQTTSCVVAIRHADMESKQ